MKASKRHENAINVLVRAFFDETLAKGTCTACAVGNLVADGLGAKVYKIVTGAFYCTRANNVWGNLFYSSMGTQEVNKECLFDRTVMTQVRSTGYTWKELARVEYAFETSTKIPSWLYHLVRPHEILQDQFNGLKAVFEVLCDIEGVDSKEYVSLLEPKLQSV